MSFLLHELLYLRIKIPEKVGKAVKNAQGMENKIPEKVKIFPYSVWVSGFSLLFRFIYFCYKTVKTELIKNLS